jgi:hypothetical protein
MTRALRRRDKFEHTSLGALLSKNNKRVLTNRKVFDMGNLAKLPSIRSVAAAEDNGGQISPNISTLPRGKSNLSHSENKMGNLFACI